MSDKLPASLRGIRLQLLDTNGAPLLGAKYRNTIIALTNALSNISVIASRGDGSSIASDIQLTELGLVITLPTGYGGSGGSGGATLSWFHFKDDLGSCLKCVTWDGTTEGGTSIYIAKNTKLRKALTSEIKQGVTYSYTYAIGSADTHGNHYLVRTISGSDGSAEVDDIDPPFLFNDEIWGMQLTTAITLDGQSCTYLDMTNSSRAWASR